MGCPIDQIIRLADDAKVGIGGCSLGRARCVLLHARGLQCFKAGIAMNAAAPCPFDDVFRREQVHLPRAGPIRAFEGIQVFVQTDTSNGVSRDRRRADRMEGRTIGLLVVEGRDQIPFLPHAAPHRSDVVRISTFRAPTNDGNACTDSGPNDTRCPLGLIQGGVA